MWELFGLENDWWRPTDSLKQVKKMGEKVYLGEGLVFVVFSPPLNTTKTKPFSVNLFIIYLLLFTFKLDVLQI